MKDNVGTMFNHRVFNPSGPTDLLLDDGVFLGIELEYNNIKAVDHHADWSIIPDGSLKDDGGEYVLKTPLAGIDLVDAINSLAASMKVSRSDIETSMHVHLNAILSDPINLANTMLVLYAFEDLLYPHKYRKASAFSIPIADVARYKGMYESIIKYLYRDENDRARELILNLERGAVRYRSVAIDCIARLGTIEIRTFPTPNTVKEALDNINIVLAMNRVANAVPPGNLVDAINWLENEGARMIQQLIPQPVGGAATPAQIENLKVRNILGDLL